MREAPRLPGAELVLRCSSLAIVVAISACGVLYAGFGIDALDYLEWAPECVFRSWTDIPCPGCGMTRALVLLGQFDFAASWLAHPAAFGLVLALVFGIVAPNRFVGPRRQAVAGIGLGFVVAFWMVRLTG